MNKLNVIKNVSKTILYMNKGIILDFLKKKKLFKISTLSFNYIITSIKSKKIGK